MNVDRDDNERVAGVGLVLLNADGIMKSKSQDMN